MQSALQFTQCFRSVDSPSKRDNPRRGVPGRRDRCSRRYILGLCGKRTRFSLSAGSSEKILETFSRLVLGVVQWWKKGTVHSVGRDRSAISRHYDQPVSFYRPWLGESLVYSCGYFESSDDDLALAQLNKLELVCRKLRLRPEDRFLDIGCGWGSLILHAASQHNVYAQGITISQEQAAVAAARIDSAQLTQSCRADLVDYREAPSRYAPFDKIASLGMFEHVGMQQLPRYFQTVYSMLKPGGIFLNHGISPSCCAGWRRHALCQVGRAVT